MTGGDQKLKETPSQTAGPYVHIGLTPEIAGITQGPRGLGRQIFTDDEKGERITISGRVLDGHGASVNDVLIEVWQANAQGEYSASGTLGWGRVTPDAATGVFEIATIKPGTFHTSSDPVAPHLNLWLVARGINIGLSTRLYFSDEEQANAADAVLQTVAPESRRNTLIAQKTESGYAFDIVLQGADETVFFDV